jgi:hypothetical protein
MPAGAHLFSTTYPLLWEHLSAESYDDGSSRQTSTLFIFIADGAFKIMLKDRQEGLVWFKTASSPEVAFASYEADLASNGGDWRRDRPTGKGGRRK